MKKLLSIENLQVSVGDTQILQELSLDLPAGQVHAIMGPNGSGKSTLALTLMGHPGYTVTGGTISFDEKNLCKLSATERAAAGIFLSFQNPPEIEGVSLREFLFQACQLDVLTFEKKLIKNLKMLNLPPDFVEKSVNYKLSGGQKKQSEMLQIAMLEPKLIILDEIDSGLDVDALKTVCDGINAIITARPQTSVLIITHYPRILHCIEPHAVHVMHNGRIVQTGSMALANEIEKEGYSL